MKIFAAITDAKTVQMFYDKTGIKLNYLISYHYLKGQAYKLTAEYRHMIKSLYLDSGAFSVSTGISKITISNTCNILNSMGRNLMLISILMINSMILSITSGTSIIWKMD